MPLHRAINTMVLGSITYRDQGTLAVDRILWERFDGGDEEHATLSNRRTRMEFIGVEGFRSDVVSWQNCVASGRAG